MRTRIWSHAKPPYYVISYKVVFTQVPENAFINHRFSESTQHMVLINLHKDGQAITNLSVQPSMQIISISLYKGWHMGFSMHCVTSKNILENVSKKYCLCNCSLPTWCKIVFPDDKRQFQETDILSTLEMNRLILIKLSLGIWDDIKRK